MENLIVAIDFVENNELLVNIAVQIAKKFQSKIWILHIAAPDPFFVGYGVGPQSERKFRADKLRDEHRIIQEISETIKKKGIDSEALLISGPTVETIIDHSKKLKADLIIIGFHKSGFLSTIFGDTTIEVLKKTKIPLLSIPTY